MAKINIYHTEKSLVITPQTGCTAIFYDVDGILKQKDDTGTVSIIGTTGFTGYSAFSTLTDVDLTTTQDGDILYYSGGNIINSSVVMSGGTDLYDIFYPISSLSITPFEFGPGTSSAQLYDSGSLASGDYSVAEGFKTATIGVCSHSEGQDTRAIGNYSHSEGKFSTASGDSSHAEGYYTTADGFISHSEGYLTQANGVYSHAEGHLSIASGLVSHAEGFFNTSIGKYSHSGGFKSKSIGELSFVHSSGSTCNHDGSAIIGGQSITSLSENTVYVPCLEIVNSGATSSQLIMTDKATGQRYEVCISGGTFILTVI